MNKATILATTLFITAFASYARAHDVPTDANEINPVEVGTLVPDAAVKTAKGEAIQLRSLTAGKPSVLVFYRGSWCPYCNRQLSGLAEVEEELLALGYQVIAFSPDKPEIVAETANEAVTYQLIADSALNAAQAFGVAFTVNDATLKKLESYDIDIEAASGETHNMLPVPAVFLTNAEGRITYRYYNANYKVRLAPEDLLKAAKAAAK